MEGLGLPMAFGKKELPSKPESSIASSSTIQRGGPAGRGDRGVVGGGKKIRGRGRGSGANSFVVASREDGGLNEGVKRSYPATINQHPSHPSLPPQPLDASDQQRGGFVPRGRGGHRGGRGGRGGGGDHGSGERGFFKESFCEDPWKGLLKEEKTTGQGKTT